MEPRPPTRESSGVVTEAGMNLWILQTRPRNPPRHYPHPQPLGLGLSLRRLTSRLTVEPRACSVPGYRPYLGFMEIQGRIMIDPSVRFGKPCVRGTRLTIGDVLCTLARGGCRLRRLIQYRKLVAAWRS